MHKLMCPSSCHMRYTRRNFSKGPMGVCCACSKEKLIPKRIRRKGFAVMYGNKRCSVTFATVVRGPFIVAQCKGIRDLRSFGGLACHSTTRTIGLFQSESFFRVLGCRSAEVGTLCGGVHG